MRGTLSGGQVQGLVRHRRSLNLSTDFSFVLYALGKNLRLFHNS